MGLIALAPEAAPLRQSRAATGGLAEHCRAAAAEHDSLGVGEHGGDVEAALALHIHEEGVGRLHEALELVLALLQRRRGMKEIDVLGEHLREDARREESTNGQGGGRGRKK